MPTLEFTTDELRDGAIAARIASSQAAHDAERQENPRIKQTLSEAARRYLTLAGKFEGARMSGAQLSNMRTQLPTLIAVRAVGLVAVVAALFRSITSLNNG